MAGDGESSLTNSGARLPNPLSPDVSQVPKWPAITVSANLPFRASWPRTGKAWGVAEAVVVSLDLDSRKIITLTDEQLALANADAIEGLSL